MLNVKTLNILSVVTFSILSLSGCATTTSDGINIEKNNNLEMKKFQAKVSSYEDRKAIPYIQVNNNTVNSILQQLSVEKTHVLVGEDMKLTKSNYKISSIKDLKDYISMFSNKRLVIEQEKNSVVKWKLINYEINPLVTSLNIEFSSKNILLSEVMKQIGKDTGYSIIPSKDILDIYNGEYKLEYYGETVQDFLDYMKSYFNIYVEIDHKYKTIKLKKYKSEIFNISVSNSNMALTRSMESGSSSSGGFGSGSISTIYSDNINPFNELSQYLDMILIQDKKLLTNNDTIIKNSYFIQKTSGKIYISADPIKMAEATKIINNFEAYQNTSISISVGIYTVELTDSSKFGLNWSAIKNNIETSANGTNVEDTFQIKSSDNMFSISAANPIEGAVKAGASFVGKEWTLSTMLESVGKFGNIKNVSKYNFTTLNNVPVSQVQSTKSPYLKSLTKEVIVDPDGGNDRVVETPTVESEDSGVFFYLRPKTFNDSNKIMINFAPIFNKITGWETVKYGNNEIIAQPIIKKETYSNNFIINKNETIVLTGMINEDSSSDYNGANPLANITNKNINALMGVNSDSVTRTESFIVITASVVE